MAYPTPVNGQITDALERVHDAGGIVALASVVGLIEAIGRGLSGAEPGADALSAAFRKAEAELQAILAGMEGGGDQG